MSEEKSRRYFRPPFHRRPPWWPEGEPWPPARAPWAGGEDGERWRGMRGQFFRRIGCAFAILLIVSIGLLTALFWMVSSSINLGNLPENTRAVLQTAPAVILFFGLIGLLLAARAVRRMAMPFGDLLDAAGRIADGDYSTRVPARGPGEVRGLAHAFNSMAERLEANDRQRRALLADVTHELRTPITVIQGNLEGMLDGIYPADTDHLQSLLDETHVLSRIIDDLRTLSLAEAGALRLQTETGELADLVEETISAFQPEALRRSIILHSDIQPNLPTLEFDPTRIREVLANLLSNALRYTPPGGTVRVLAARDGTALTVSVQDSGSGISAEDLPHIFDRFYKSADSRGTGLGLAIAKSLVSAHGGAITAESQPGQGTKITVKLPMK